ncbi:protein kinase domain-containing protein [Deinococcus cellulosilyticus]|uniref:Protein kinase domain-containing protein n=1 Tax=Deinococcus cellulosilyticus (strain DSM 18568 / NBRC 106333 / KACC 11606 / 5516J-15) TaxID=1223518 RepID=A0A511N606_DEIC1|nr:protein kinase [Deinococcus cellulosilyticus]GEM47841.1 hypothetical protein DC3_34760 [Deinococcus cellulosilyticus NBRC 106333 = KACC 11606]
MNCPSCNEPITDDMRVCPSCGMPLQSQLKVGTRLQLGKYTVGRVLGQGGFGITYLGANTILKMPVAIKELFMEGMARGNTGKVLAPAHTEFADEKLRFLDEARKLGQFSHPNIVRVFDVFEENNTVYLVMEYLQGETLGKRIETRGSLSSREVLDILYPLLDALKVLHDQNMLHRDIKPQNVYLTTSGRTVLIDFGSVRTFTAGKASNHTRLVTVGYAPLEQYATSAKVGPYTDLYALGATIFHALTGAPPPAVLDRINGMPLPPLPAGTDPLLAQVVHKTLALQIEDRPQSIAQMREWLQMPSRPQPAAVGNPASKNTPEVPLRPTAPPADERLLSRSGRRYALISKPLKAPLYAREQGFHYDYDTESVVEVEDGILRLAFKSRGFDQDSVSIRWIRNDGERTHDIEMFDLPLEVDLDHIPQQYSALEYQLYHGRDARVVGYVDLIDAAYKDASVHDHRLRSQRAFLNNKPTYKKIPVVHIEKYASGAFMDVRFRDTTARNGDHLIFDAAGARGDVKITYGDWNEYFPLPFALDLTSLAGELEYTIRVDTPLALGNEFQGKVFFFYD